MSPRARKYLWDIQDAAAAVTEFLDGKSFADYQNDRMLRSAVERQLIIVGEAMAALSRQFPEITARITEHHQVIAFRNVLVHGYDDLNHQNIWSIVENKLPILVMETRELLEASAS